MLAVLLFAFFAPTQQAGIEEAALTGAQHRLDFTVGSEGPWASSVGTQVERFVPRIHMKNEYI